MHSKVAFSPTSPGTRQSYKPCPKSKSEPELHRIEEE